MRAIEFDAEDDDLRPETWDRFAARSISHYYVPEDAIYDDYPRG